MDLKVEQEQNNADAVMWVTENQYVRLCDQTYMGQSSER